MDTNNTSRDLFESSYGSDVEKFLYSFELHLYFRLLQTIGWSIHSKSLPVLNFESIFSLCIDIN